MFGFLRSQRIANRPPHRYEVQGGPLAGQTVPLLDAHEQNAFAGGVYRLVEPDFWGFSGVVPLGVFYHWYEGGRKNPDYQWDKIHYGWTH
ncbi:hypothetical protein [Rhizobium sp. MHM7A]|uniref:hypothetical protein n=1 Tax=Rhizobium sp. MHM7A TaxID=2583233 RepID=UPI00110675A7|nr:hypothetical protein [Rhizobium sp. MHM7A]TLX16665.1 hypothetical protein FFR93_04805 [Rhizobium sp. MHM7A]